jgi:hypothetical protein
VHGYSIPQLNEFWAHSDIDGSFFVIPVDNINTTEAPVAVGCLRHSDLPPDRRVFCQ